MRSFFTFEAKVFRKEYTNNKSSTNNTWIVCLWYLSPISIENNINIETFWQNYKYTTDIKNDIREGDVLEINNEKYTVKWTAEYSWLDDIFYLKCIIVKW